VAGVPTRGLGFIQVNKKNKTKNTGTNPQPNQIYHRSTKNAFRQPQQNSKRRHQNRKKKTHLGKPKVNKQILLGGKTGTKLANSA